MNIAPVLNALWNLRFHKIVDHAHTKHVLSDFQKLVRQFVPFQRTWRKMFGEYGAAGLDRGHEAVCKTACKTFQIPGVNSVQ